jgi:hypothetical protein
MSGSIMKVRRFFTATAILRKAPPHPLRNNGLARP